MLNMKIHHVGIAVKSINKSCAVYKNLGFTDDGCLVRDTTRNINILFMKKDSYRIELIERAVPEIASPVDKFLLQPTEHAIYHTCYIVKNIDEQIKLLANYAFVLIDNPKPAAAFSKKQVCFLYNQNVGMIELLEE